ncbi:MAG: hypothetical protein DME12_19395 [Candidatus Rokuibacteriota bacterium]|nr:MAG: hypothetical protein DME12_19395 [Candidatus Rokubacteria bacterium]
MRAQVLHEWGGRLSYETVGDPRIGPTDALIRVEACGVGLTVLNYTNGNHGRRPEDLPRIPGHEAVGTVVEVGAAVGTLSAGQLRGLPRAPGEKSPPGARRRLGRARHGDSRRDRDAVPCQPPGVDRSRRHRDRHGRGRRRRYPHGPDGPGVRWRGHRDRPGGPQAQGAE